MLDLTTQLSLGLDVQEAVSSRFSTLSAQTWPFSLEWLPDSAYLVGGSVRDALLGRYSEYLDLDFVLPEGVVETARAIARHYKAGFVLLDADRQIARVVFPQGTVDFAQQVGPTLESDLKRRDFTVNAIAYNPRTEQLVDPLQGSVDLRKRLLRMVSAENLEEDPLRLLRAYRQAAQLEFSLEPETQFVIRRLALSLRHIAAERVQSELNYLLSTVQGTPWLTQAWRDGLLQDWLPDATGYSLQLIAAIDQTVVLLQEMLPDFARGLFSHARPDPSSGSPKAGKNVNLSNDLELKASGSARNWLITAKLACLLPPNPAAAEIQLRRLKYSRAESQSVATVLKFLPQLLAAATLYKDETVVPGLTPLSLTLREQYFFFQGVGIAFPAIAVLAIAQGLPLDAIAPLIERFLTPNDPVAHSTPLLTGQDLMTRLNLPAGPLIGQLLAAIQLARAEGTIATPAEALDLAKTLAERSRQA